MPPVPLMIPDRVPEAAVIVSVLAPKAVAPVPDNVLTLMPEVSAFRALMLKVPLFLTALELAILPEPDSAKVAPVLMVVTPV